jgi:hypothetical protein
VAVPAAHIPAVSIASANRRQPTGAST